VTISLKYTNLTVTSVDEALGFYRDALGLGVVQDVGAGAFRWVTLGSAAQPGLGIVLSEPQAGRPEEDADVLQVLLAKGSMPLIVFETDDLDAMFEKVRASGAEVMQEPMEQAWGPRDCAFKDPSGTTVRIAAAS
jgi:catechol 2,3-dioxygenase-like lactoylglutathione lyase family enzyme